MNIIIAGCSDQCPFVNEIFKTSKRVFYCSHPSLFSSEKEFNFVSELGAKEPFNIAPDFCPLKIESTILSLKEN